MTSPEPAHTNALAHETSPYLLQHAHNPADWHPWGPAAFELSKTSGKPIFLSIGYSTCYWCHVMERQCFENPHIAALMNEHFINIKVDREERPDVDDIYMAAVQILTGRGGWPMSVFLTPPAADGADPGLKPFFAGTYFPPEPSHGMPSFPQVLTGIAGAWTTRRDDVLKQADEVAGAVKQHLAQSEPAGELSPRAVQTAANQLIRTYDPHHGGFGTAPKFPQPCNLQFLLKVHQNNPNDQLWQSLRHTLDRMARGGMYDQIGGGFHRYSTDEKWLVPHFEKMLYDNAQLVETYLTAHEIKPPPRDLTYYTDVARQTCDYVLREMLDPTGCFWSAQDAEVDGMEGANYLWTPAQVRQAITDEKLAGLAIRFLGLDFGTNFQDPHHPDSPPSNVLYQPVPFHEFAQQNGLSVDQLVEAVLKIDAQLLAARDQRKQPRTDDKVLTGWNGMMIAALARAGRTVNEPRYIQAAAKAADWLLLHMRTPDGGLHRTMRRGQTKIDGFLEDYAYLAHGLIELHRADPNGPWLARAEEIMAQAAKRFGAASNTSATQPGTDHPTGGYYDTLPDQADLFVRTRSTYDGAIPSGNSQMVHNLLDLYELSGKAEYFGQAAGDLRAFAGAIQRSGAIMAHMQHALLRALEIDSARLTGPATAPRTRPATEQLLTAEVSPAVIDLSTGSADLQVTIKIVPGYHINAADPGLANLIATSLALADGDDLQLEVHYPPGKTVTYPLADDPIRVYEDQVVIKAIIHTADAKAVSSGAKLLLRYQICTDRHCLEPGELELEATFKTGR